MRQIALLIVAVVFLLSSDDVFAQCKKCDRDVNNCLVCVDTYYNGKVLCELRLNGTMCLGQGECTGVLGDCGGRCRTLDAKLPARNINSLDDASGALIEVRLAESFPAFIQASAEWQLVSVKMSHVKISS